jgi:hypothetical protein
MLEIGGVAEVSKSFQLEEEALKASMPNCGRRSLESKN